MKTRGPWSIPEMDRFLSGSTIPVRLAVLPPSGVPLVASLWFLWDDGALWCATQAGSRLAAALRHREKVGFEVAADTPPYRGIRGQGSARLMDAEGRSVLERLLVRYRIAPGSGLEKYLLAQAKTEVAIRITPDWVSSWDYSDRMSDADGALKS